MEYAHIAWWITDSALKIKGWSDKLADVLGITSTNWRIALAVGLGLIVLLAIGLILKWGGKWLWKWFGKKSELFTIAHKDEAKQEEQEDELNPDDIRVKVSERHEVVLLDAEVPHTITMHEGHHEGPSFDWSFGMKTYLYGREYKARLKGSIEGRIDLTRVRVEVEKLKVQIPVLQKQIHKINVNVSIPAGFFTANFDLMDINEIKNEAGLLANKYTISDIQKAFEKQYKRIVREYIENEKMLSRAKDIAVEDIKGFIESLMKELGFKDIPGIREYKVNVRFASGKWYIFRGARKQKPIDAIIDTSGQENETSSEEQVNLNQSAKS